MTEKKFKVFLRNYNIEMNDKTFYHPALPIIILQAFTEHYMTSTGKIDMLSNIILNGNQVINNFSKNETYSIYKLTKKEINHIANILQGEMSIKNLKAIIESFESSNDDDYLYFIIEK
jgi:hypothetical protein